MLGFNFNVLVSVRVIGVILADCVLGGVVGVVDCACDTCDGGALWVCTGAEGFGCCVIVGTAVGVSHWPGRVENRRTR